MADPAQAAQLYGRACDGGYGNACNRLSAMVFRATGGLAKDDARAVALLEKGCKLGDRGTCVVLAMRLIGGTGVAKDEKEGKEMLREACAAGEQMACKLEEGGRYKSPSSHVVAPERRLTSEGRHAPLVGRAPDRRGATPVALRRWAWCTGLHHPCAFIGRSDWHGPCDRCEPWQRK